MSKHTPGPWTFSRWDQYGDTRFYVAQAECAPYTPNYSDVSTLISETVSIERVLIQEANARLIAAAPDLLEALKDMLDGHEDACSGYGEGAADKARAAIFKATGGTA